MKDRFKEWIDYIKDPNNILSVYFDMLWLCLTILIIALTLSGGHS